MQKLGGTKEAAMVAQCPLQTVRIRSDLLMPAAFGKWEGNYVASCYAWGFWQSPPPPMCSGVKPASVQIDHTPVTLDYSVFFNKPVSQPLKHFVSNFHLIVFG